jgi:hypothetical protein
VLDESMNRRIVATAAGRFLGARLSVTFPTAPAKNAVAPPRDTAWAMSEENVELARKAIDALNRADFDALLAFFSPDVV